MSENLLQKWTQVTSNLDWGKQRVLHDTLTLAGEGKIQVVYGADEFNGSPCLINAVGCMVKGQAESPSINEPAIVRLFDQLNRQFHEQGVNEHSHYMSPLAAEILVRFFSPLKEMPFETPMPEPTVYFVEPSDDEIQAAWTGALSEEPMSEDDLKTLHAAMLRETEQSE